MVNIDFFFFGAHDLNYMNLSGQMDIHGGVGWPVAHGEDVDSQIDVAGFTLILHVLKWQDMETMSSVTTTTC